MENQLLQQYSWQYRKLQEILSGTVELFPVESLGSLKLPSAQEGLVKFVIKRNMKGIAPIGRKIADDMGCSYSYYRHVSSGMVCQKPPLIVNPSVMDYADIFGKREGTHFNFSATPANVSKILCMYKTSHRGNSFNWNVKTSPEHSKNYSRAFLALFYDGDVPVYKNCFPKNELKFVPKSLV